MKFPGTNTVTLCTSALMQIVETALNERTYDAKDSPVRVIDVKARQDSMTTVFDVVVTTDKQEPA